ncbi:hypothetical protein V2J09_002323 [Rumex salicifolius]
MLRPMYISSFEPVSSMETKTERPPLFPEEALQHVLSFIDSHADRNSVSLVCKSWYDIERWCRHNVHIGNCYAVSPPILIRRFTDVRSITIKGKHLVAEYDLVPEGWGGHAFPWIAALAAAFPAMEEMRLKRMVVTDEGLELIGRKLKNLRSLMLHKCEGFSTVGLASIAANCRGLRKLDLYDSEVDDQGGNWLSNFPDSYTSLEFLNVHCLTSDLDVSSLQGLVGRCPNLRALGVNHSFGLQNLINLSLKATQLDDLGIGLFTTEPCSQEAFVHAFEGLKSLSGLWDVTPYYLPTLHPLCSGLTSLDLSRSTLLRCPDLVKLIRHCSNLQRLCVLDCIEDGGLEEVGASCKELQELRVVLSDPYNTDPSIRLTERGLVSLALGSPKLHYILYLCSQMTNEALVTMANHKPNLTCFRLLILEPHLPDCLTHEPLDDGFAAIVERCKSLRRLVVTGLVTDRLLRHIGHYGTKLEVLCFAFSGNTDMGFHYVISGCSNLRKLVTRDCPFSGQAMLANSDRLERLQSLWMSSCPVSYATCNMLGEKNPRLNVEVINEKGPLDFESDESLVENLYTTLYAVLLLNCCGMASINHCRLCLLSSLVPNTNQSFQYLTFLLLHL